MHARRWLPLLSLLALAGGAAPADDKPGEWALLFNGKDLTGWKLRHEKYTLTKFVDASGQEIKGAKKAKLDQTTTVVDAKGKPIEGAKVVKVENKEVAVDASGQPLKDAKIARSGGRDAVVGADGKEIKDAKEVKEEVANPTGGWKVEDGVLICGTGPRGSDIYTDRKFTDFELHVEFQPTGNSGVYLLGLYEIQIDNSKNVKPTVVEKDGQKVEVLPKTICGAIYGRIAPSKNMARDAKEWQTFDVTFRAARGDAKAVKEKARVTVVWNGEKVIDNAEIDGPTGAALAGKETEPGPLLLQGDHGRVSFRNVKIRPLTGK
jgi:hypothetical protein